MINMYKILVLNLEGKNLHLFQR